MKPFSSVPMAQTTGTEMSAPTMTSAVNTTRYGMIICDPNRNSKHFSP